MEDEEQDPKEYRWETGYERTWEAIKEDKDGLVESLVAEFAQKQAKKAAEPRRGPVRLGMMRHLLVAIDCSDAMNSQDLKPTRFLCTLKLLEKFVEEYFDQNPLSQLGIILMKNKRAEKITELSGNVRKHIKALQGLSNLSLTGEPSLQNTLELAGKVLRPLPGHASRELLVLFASLTTCDPGDINTTIQALKTDGIRCSLIGLAAEVRICKKLCQDTTGEYGLAANASAIVRLAVTILACILLLKVTRRAVVLVSGLGTAACTLGLAYLLYWGKGTGIMPPLLILGYVAFNTLGFFLLPGLMIGELLPTKVRGLCGGYIFCLFNAVLFGFTKLFPVMKTELGMSGVFGVFGASAALATVMLFLLLPETKGKSLIQIEQYYQKPNILWVTRKKGEGQNV